MDWRQTSVHTHAHTHTHTHTHTRTHTYTHTQTYTHTSHTYQGTLLDRKQTTVHSVWHLHLSPTGVRFRIAAKSSLSDFRYVVNTTNSKIHPWVTNSMSRLMYTIVYSKSSLSISRLSDFGCVANTTNSTIHLKLTNSLSRLRYTIAYCQIMSLDMGWLQLVGSFELYVSFAQEPYKRDYILQKWPIILRSLLIVATPHQVSLTLGASPQFHQHNESSKCHELLLSCEYKDFNHGVATISRLLKFTGLFGRI